MTWFQSRAVYKKILEIGDTGDRNVAGGIRCLRILPVLSGHFCLHLKWIVASKSLQGRDTPRPEGVPILALVGVNKRPITDINIPFMGSPSVDSIVMQIYFKIFH